MVPGPDISHIAYADESYIHARYRSISIVTLENENRQWVTGSFRTILHDSGITEFKWNKLRQARERFAAVKFINEVIELALQEVLKVDILIWDAKPSACSLSQRDGFPVLQQMVSHLFRSVVENRWPGCNRWLLLPDENAGLDWQTVKGTLEEAGVSLRMAHRRCEKNPFHSGFHREYRIKDIEQISSIEEPLCQVADLFAGIGAYSYIKSARYLAWISRGNGQRNTQVGQKVSAEAYSNSETERFCILRHLEDHCTANRLRVSLVTGRGFHTEHADSPLNFQFHESLNTIDVDEIEKKSLAALHNTKSPAPSWR